MVPGTEGLTERRGACSGPGRSEEVRLKYLGLTGLQLGVYTNTFDSGSPLTHRSLGIPTPPSRLTPESFQGDVSRTRD